MTIYQSKMSYFPHSAHWTVFSPFDGGAKEAAHLISCIPRRNMTQPPADSASWLPVPGDLDYFHSLSNDGVLRFPGSIEKVEVTGETEFTSKIPR